MLDDIPSGALIGGICGLIGLMINKLRGKEKLSTPASVINNQSAPMAILGKGDFMSECLFPLPNNAICISTVIHLGAP